jgi:integrase
MAKALTAHGVEKAKAGGARREIVDAAVDGLRLIIQPTGAKSWGFRYSFGGKHHKKTIGRYPGIPLGDAREAARAALRALGRGIDPSRSGVASGSLDAAIASYKRLHVAGLRPSTRYYVERELARAAKAWAGRPVNEVKRRDVIALVDEAAERGPNAGNCCLQVASAFFAWCLSRDLVEFNPAIGVRRVAPAPVRDRVLDDAELVAVWNAADKVGGRYGAFTKMLMLTGARRDEMAKLEPGEFRNDAIELPAHKVKTGTSHRIALTPMMRQVLDTLPKTNMRYVMTGTDAPISHGDAPKKAIVTPSVAPWRFHDLRRSFATGLAILGVLPHIIELTLNHKPRGITAVYQRHRYDADVKAAFELWSKHVATITKAG